MAPALRGEIDRRNYLLNGPIEELNALIRGAAAKGFPLVQQEALDASIYGSAMVAVFQPQRRHGVQQRHLRVG